MTSNKPNQDESASRKRSLDAVNEPETGAELRPLSSKYPQK
jgi:hypothetical protein